MKKTYYITAFCLFIATLCVVWNLCRMPVTKEGNANEETATAIINVEQEEEHFEEKEDAGMATETDIPAKTMPLLEKDDAIGSVKERLRIMMRVMHRRYEKYLLEKYANTSKEERDKRFGETCYGNEEERKEAEEIRDFDLLWHYVTYIPNPNISHSDVLLVFPTDKMQMLWKLKLLESGFGWEGEEGETEEDRKLTDEQREFVNQIIVAERIPPKDPGIPFSYHNSTTLTDMDKAYINEIIKGNPNIEVPWER